jgi:hypothetical protein
VSCLCRQVKGTNKWPEESAEGERSPKAMAASIWRGSLAEADSWRAYAG